MKITLNAHALYRGTHLGLEEVKSSLAGKIEVSPINNQEIHIETDSRFPVKLPSIFEIASNTLKIRITNFEKIMLTCLVLEKEMILRICPKPVRILPLFFSGFCIKPVVEIAQDS